MTAYYLPGSLHHYFMQYPHLSYNVGSVNHTHFVDEETEVQKGKETNYSSTKFQNQVSIQQFNTIGGSLKLCTILPLTLIEILHRLEI